MKIVFKSWILAMVVHAAALSQENKPLVQLVETEKAFAKAAIEQGVKAAFVEFFADEGVVFQPQAVNAREFWNARPDSPSLLVWNPVWADTSDNGEIGYTTGDWDFRPTGKNDQPVAFGQYITIWQKQADGKFKALVDLGVSHAKPTQVPTNWSSPKKSADSEQPSVSVAQPSPDSILKVMNLQTYEEVLADDVRLYRDQKLPMIGKPNATAQIRSELEGIKSAKVIDSHTGGTSDFHFGYGVLESTGNDDQMTRANLLRIWKRRDNRWKLTLEVVSALPEQSR